ncbi:Glycine receptor subunit alpha-2 [Exaiptasia diaphana]|nr:Glycine receptor subunit alpha-2 [Exaiptasia diaphana]
MVNYVKAIDKYLITCFLFVFASLVEYAILLTFIHRQHQHKSQETNRRKKTSSTSTITNDDIIARDKARDKADYLEEPEDGKREWHRKYSVKWIDLGL